MERQYFLDVKGGILCEVDADIWLRFCRYKWRMKKSASEYYVVRSVHYKDPDTGKRICRTIRLHREVMDCPADKEVHHRNSDTLNCKRENLEIVTPEAHGKKSLVKRWS